MSSLLSSLKRQPALRNRSSPKASSSRKVSASTKGRRLSILPELSEDDADESFGVLANDQPLVSSTGRKRLTPSDIFVDEALVFERPRPAPRPPVRAPSANQPVRLSAFDFDMAVPASAPKKAATSRASKRASRYGKEDVFTCPAELDALPSPSPNRSSKRFSRYGKAELGLQETEDVFSAARASVRLSAFEFNFPTDVDSESAPSAPCTPIRSLSPTDSLSSDYTSSSVTSSGGMPLTPSTSDDEWSFPCPRVPIRPLVITKATPGAQPTLVMAQEDEDEDDGIWYTRELGSRFNLGSPLALSAAAPSTHGSARPDSLPPPRRGEPSNRNRYSKPLPAVPRTLGPSAQLDPTFSSLPPPLPSSPPPSHLAARSRHSLRARKSLTITVPRPPPRKSVPADVADILDDIAAWELTSLAPTSASGALSPPRLPESPWSAFSLDADADVHGHAAVQAVNGDAAVLETRPVVVAPDPAVAPAPSLPAIVVSALESPSVPETPVLAQTKPARTTASSPLADDEREGSEDSFGLDSPVLRSRWSSSTLSSLVDAPQSASSRMLHFPFGAVAKRVRRSKRVSGPAKAVEAPSPRHSIESSVSEGGSESGESSTSSGLRRKPIPVEIFMR